MTEFKQVILSPLFTMASLGHQVEFLQKSFQLSRLSKIEFKRVVKSLWNQRGEEEELPESYLIAFPSSTDSMIKRDRRLKALSEKSIARRAEIAEGTRIFNSWNLPTLKDTDLIKLGAITSSSNKQLKVLVLCASSDNLNEMNRTLEIIRLFHPGIDWNRIELFILNPEPYEHKSRDQTVIPDRYTDTPLIDRNHYFNIPFGVTIYNKQHVDDSKLLQTGPFDFIIYMTCAIYGGRSPYGNTGKTIEKEREQLSIIANKDTILIVQPLYGESGKNALFGTYRLINDYHSLGFNILGFANLKDPLGDGTIGVFSRLV